MADIINGTALKWLNLEDLDVHTSLNTTTSTDNATWGFDLQDIDSLDITYLTARSVISAAAIVGNSLTLIALGKYPKIRATTNLLIGNLACWDLFSSCIIGVKSAMTFLGGTDHYPTLCLFKPILTVIYLAGAGHAMLFLALDKVYMIMFPLRYIRGPSARAISTFLFVYNTCLIGLHACLFAVGRKAPPYPLCNAYQVLGYAFQHTIILLGVKSHVNCL